MLKGGCLREQFWIYYILDQEKKYSGICVVVKYNFYEFLLNIFFIVIKDNIVNDKLLLI